MDGLGSETGAGDRNRTYDPIITNDVLYQLSYSGGRARILGEDTGLGKLCPKSARSGPKLAA